MSNERVRKRARELHQQARDAANSAKSTQNIVEVPIDLVSESDVEAAELLRREMPADVKSVRITADQILIEVIRANEDAGGILK